MPMIMASDSPPQGMPLGQPTDYPVQTKHAAGLVDGQLTDVTTLYFTDKIMVTITQSGRLAQWVSMCKKSPTDLMHLHSP
jgi:proteasome assembly chaperone 3